MESQAGASPYFSRTEQSYLSKLGAAMQYRVEVSVVRMWLMKARAEGLDPQRIYQAAVQIRLPQWEPAPPFEVIFPGWG